jgi:anti-sigma regulatory factor (Ser/Thr protein kinase)
MEREVACFSKITIEAAVLRHDIFVKISDEGSGFDFMKYLNMSQEEQFDRLELPNGRGINISRLFFDSIEYEKGGSSVVLQKKASAAVEGPPYSQQSHPIN